MSNPKPPFVERRKRPRQCTQGMDETVGQAQMLTGADRVYAWRVRLDELLDSYVYACKALDQQDSFLRPTLARKQAVATCLAAIYDHAAIRPLGPCRS